MPTASNVPWSYDHVAVDADPLEALADRLAATELTAPNWRMPVYPDDDLRFVQFIGVQNAINTHFNDPVTLTKYTVTLDGVPWTGAAGLCAALTRAAAGGHDLCVAEHLQRLTLTEAAELLAGDDVAFPMLAERVMHLNNVGATLIAEFGGSFLNVVAEAGYDAPTLIETLVERFAAYGTDRWMHPRTKELLAFDKRARLFALMCEGRARDSEVLTPLSNLDAVGAVVDYQLPRLLRAANVFVYAPSLSDPIENQHLLVAGSEAELALRDATEFTVERLLEEVNARIDTPVTMVGLDHALWSAGRNTDGEHHLSATLAY